MIHSHLLRLIVVLSLVGTMAASAADPDTNAPAAAAPAVTNADAHAAVKKEVKEAKKKARQAAKEAEAARTKAEQEAKKAAKAAKEAKKAEQKARKKAKEQAAAEATNPPPVVAVAEAPAAPTTNVVQELPKKEEKVPWRTRLRTSWKEWKKGAPAAVAATNVEAQVQAPAEPEKIVETHVPLEKPAAPELAMGERISARWEEGEYGIVVGLDYILPSDSEVWKKAYAADIEARRWMGEDFGMSVVLGYGMWNVNKDADPLGGKDQINPATMSGSADTISFGLGGLYRLPLADQYQLILDAGLKYVFVDSSVEMHFDFEGHHSDFNVVSPVYPGDRLAGWIGATLSGSVEEDARVSVQLGVGYQFDLTRESENWLYEDVANDLNALVVRLAVGF